jgi:hypothetical protein
MLAPRSASAAARLRDLGTLLDEAIETLASQLEASTAPNIGPEASSKRNIVSHEEYHASRVIHAALGSLEALVVTPPSFLLRLSMSYSISRALHIAAQHNIAKLLSEADDGVSIDALATSTGVEEEKLRG